MNLDFPMPPKWTESAVCAQVDPAMFFPAKGGRIGPARLICARCPVKAPCLAFALEHHDEHGIYGGTTYKERRAIRKAAAS